MGGALPARDEGESEGGRWKRSLHRGFGISGRAQHDALPQEKEGGTEGTKTPPASTYARSRLGSLC